MLGDKRDKNGNELEMVTVQSSSKKKLWVIAIVQLKDYWLRGDARVIVQIYHPTTATVRETYSQTETNTRILSALI